MRKLPAVLARGLFFCLFCHSIAFAAPDPRDSIILESKTVYPGAGSPALYLRVSFTNKDTIVAYNLTLVEKSISGGAYVVLSQPRTYDGAVRHLDSTLNNMKGENFNPYNGVSPDTFIVGGFADVNNASDWQPPNLTRKAFLEIKFDTVRSASGTVVIDSVTWAKGMSRMFVQFVNNQWEPVEVNFLKSTITVTQPPPPPPPCDLSADGVLTATDVVLAINCIFSGGPKCGNYSSPSRLVILLNELFMNPEAPLIPPPSCD